MIKLDYSLATPEERNELVKKILEENLYPGSKYLEILADYLILPIEKQERKEKNILTGNRMATVNKRETSFEGLADKMENREDGIYNIITENRHTIFQHKVSITQQDLKDIPPLAQITESIHELEGKLPTAQGKDIFRIKQAIIELRKERYAVKNAYRKPILLAQSTRGEDVRYLEEQIWLDKKGTICYQGLTLLDPRVVSEFLCNYSKLRQECDGDFLGDMWYMFYDFECYCDKALKDLPIYERIVEYKIDGLQNIDIKERLQEEFGTTHSPEYISNLWRNKIPKVIAAVAEEEWLLHHFLMEEKGHWKKCTRCGEIKLAHNRYFSKNATSRDGYYSICKKCRNKQ